MTNPSETKFRFQYNKISRRYFILRSLLLSFLFLHFAFIATCQIIISQYYEGSSNNKWIEITNIGSTSINLISPQQYLCLYANAAADNPSGLSPNNSVALTGTLISGSSLLYKNSGALLPSYATGTSTSICGFNGDDLVILSSSNGINAWTDKIDVVGNGESWGTDKSFYRKSTITAPNTNYTSSEWTLATNAIVDNSISNTSEYLGYHLYTSTPATPNISINISALTDFNYMNNHGPSESQTFTVSGSSLTANITVTPPLNYELSSNNINFESTPITLTQTGGIVTSTHLYARMKASLAVGIYNGETIICSSTGATDQIITCSGTVDPEPPAGIPNAWINEIHYDNASADVNEMVEVVLEFAELYKLSNFSVVLYNGGNGTSYNTTTLNNFTAGVKVGNYSLFHFIYPVNGMQNGAPDGLALVYNNTAIQLLSYEGTFTATNGAATGITSTDIRVIENNKPAGNSLQLIGTGLVYSDFIWHDPLASPGILNDYQYLGTPGPAVPVDWRFMVLLFAIVAISIGIKSTFRNH